uniref:dTDP-4-dehydrorhamnose reductase family protein n=1 Tax=Polynucleobacter sp. TaxID=2029855 RepID=UPI004047AF76
MRDSHSEKVLILGSSGLLGCTLTPIIKNCYSEVITQSKNGASDFKVDLSDCESAHKMLDEVKPSIIINLVGLTDVDLCERDPNFAYLVNVSVVENIVEWISSSDIKCHLIHISTDHVYDGSELHTEKHVTLKNTYALTKYAGELAARLTPSTILRTNFFGPSYCKNRISFTDWIYGALKDGIETKVYEDIFFSPISMSTLAELIKICINKKPIGVFNIGTHDGMSKADFAFHFSRELSITNHKLIRSLSNEHGILKACRPKGMTMNVLKLEKSIGIDLPELRQEIKKIVREYKNESK